MLFGGMVIYVYIIMDGKNTGEMVCHLVHAHLKDNLRHLQTEWHEHEPVPATEGVKGGQVGAFLVEVYAREAILCFQFAEASSIN